jgi:hypothetical protein
LAAVCLLVGVSCSSPASNTECFCSANVPIQVVIPKDRVVYVATVDATGPCKPTPIVGPQVVPSTYSIDLTGTGICHVTVSFRLGSPDFTADVNLSEVTQSCCPGLVAEPSVVVVPELGPPDASTD